MRPLSISVEDKKDGKALLVKIDEDTHFGAQLEPGIIDLLENSIKEWDSDILIYYDKYDEERGKTFFVHDIVKLMEYLKKIENIVDIQSLLKIGDYTEILHNRWLSYFMHYFNSIGCDIDINMENALSPKKHDFNLNNIRCEVKTIQILSTVDISETPRAGMCFEPTSLDHLFDKLNDIIHEANIQVGDDGIIFIIFWCLGTNALLYQYFSPVLHRDLKNIKKGDVVLCIEYPIIMENQFKTKSSKRFFITSIFNYKEYLDELYDFLKKKRIRPYPISISFFPPDIHVFFRAKGLFDYGTKIKIKFPNKANENM